MSDDFKYKSRIVKKTVKDEEGNLRTIEEKAVVYWSRKFQARAERENKQFPDFLKKLQEHPETFRITATQSKSLRKFFKKECVNEKTGEILDSSKIKAFLDFDKEKRIFTVQNGAQKDSVLLSQVANSGNIITFTSCQARRRFSYIFLPTNFRLIPLSCHNVRY